MSIIYEALKKVASSIDKKPQVTTPAAKSKRKVYLLYVLIVSLGFAIANIFFNFVVKPPESRVNLPAVKAGPAPVSLSLPSAKPSLPKDAAVAPQPDQEKEEFQAEFTLNGVFFSQDKGYALINNRIVEEGDLVEGSRVERITLEEVELKSPNGSAIKLRNSPS